NRVQHFPPRHRQQLRQEAQSHPRSPDCLSRSHHLPASTSYLDASELEPALPAKREKYPRIGIRPRRNLHRAQFSSQKTAPRCPRVSLNPQTPLHQVFPVSFSSFVVQNPPHCFVQIQRHKFRLPRPIRSVPRVLTFSISSPHENTLPSNSMPKFNVRSPVSHK